MSHPINRRGFVTGAVKATGAAAIFPLLMAELANAAETNAITKADISAASLLAGVSFTEPEREMMLEDVQSGLKAYTEIHELNIPNSVAPALDFNPVLPGMTFETARRTMRLSKAGDLEAPKNLDHAAFYSVRQLAELVRRKKVSSLDLTQMYLARLKRYDPVLHFVVTLTEDRALDQAKQADREIAAGKYRGPLHGIPWGAKDLIAVKGYPTTWGAGGYEKQAFDEDATVMKRLDEAGAVLVAKLTLGALAMGDVWFGGMTRNPWKVEQGSSGSSAGSASATAAGCVAFAIGSETLGSISSPSTRCGVTGLRPTFGYVPRSGAMTLCWTWDKLGPITRSAEDCALVLNAIHGPDGKDLDCIHPAAFNWNADFDWRQLRVGYLKSAFELKDEEEKPADASEPPEKTPEAAMS